VLVWEMQRPLPLVLLCVCAQLCGGSDGGYSYDGDDDDGESVFNQTVDCLQNRSDAPAVVGGLVGLLNTSALVNDTAVILMAPNPALQTLLAAWRLVSQQSFYNLAFATEAGDFYGIHMCHGSMAQRSYCTGLPEPSSAVVFADGQHSQNVTILYLVLPNCTENVPSAAENCVGEELAVTSAVQSPANLTWYTYAEAQLGEEGSGEAGGVPPQASGSWMPALVAGSLVDPSSDPDKLVYTAPLLTANGSFIGAAMSLAETNFLGCDISAPAPPPAPPSPADPAAPRLLPVQITAIVFASLLGLTLTVCVVVQCRRGGCSRPRAAQEQPAISDGTAEIDLNLVGGARGGRGGRPVVTVHDTDKCEQ